MSNSEHWKERVAALPDEPLMHVDPDFPKWSSGKVREVYDLGDKLLIVATDRISAFDVIMEQGIPGKGIILTQLSRFWFEKSESWGLVENHLLPGQDEKLEQYLGGDRNLLLRSMLVKKLKPVPMEAVVRGYLAGSGWKSYRETGALFDRDIPAGLRESEALPAPEFTPSTKASSGHDEPLSHEEAIRLIGREKFESIRGWSLGLYGRAVEIARRAGIILADTKFEFGETESGEIFLMDEIFTPDSSRYWPADEYVVGRSQKSYDKQYLRDYLETCDWNKQAPPPQLDESIIRGTLERYRTAFLRLTSSED